MKYLSLFSGVEGGGLAFQHLIKPKITCIGYVEIDEYCQKVIRQRQIDELLDKAPIYGDIRTFIDSGCAELYTGITDVVTGGFPCQDISCANTTKEREGIEGERSGLWQEMAEVVRKVRPDYVFVENSPDITIRGLEAILKDLAEMGFNARWGCISASQIGAPHKRRRFWLVAYSNNKRPFSFRQNINGEKGTRFKEAIRCRDRGVFKMGSEGIAIRSRQWPLPPEPVRVADGIPAHLDRLKAIGNGQVPQVAALAWEILNN